MRTLAVLPVKSFGQAKQRLREEVSPQLRASLAEAMVSDVLDALGRSECIDEVLVVTAGSRPREIASARGARVIADRESGHNDAAALGIAAAIERGAERVLLVPGDCPALDPEELDALLRRPAVSPSVVIVPDRHGTGTNALLLAPPEVMPPSFGPGSCARHTEHARARRVHCEVVEVPTLAFDVDTPEDLEALSTLAARAPRTLALLAKC
jgi:2-phospho-L-lactate/phosphoenolpyruvate guanylyltransferase